jgi:glycosyltransferase involved in cell wall biosynthesis
MFSYDAIVRTYNSAATFADTLAGLRSQAPPPARIIVIDSGSTDDTLPIATAWECECHAYVGGAFNYSRSLNQGLSRVTAPFVLVLSSHAVLIDSSAVARMQACLEDARVAAAYIVHTKPEPGVVLISSANFNGENGLWNACALYKTAVAKRLAFDERLPTCEDQHFAKRLYEEGLATAAVSGSYLDYRNRRYSRLKDRNEYVAIAAYVFRGKMAWPVITRIAMAGCKGVLTGRFADAADRFALAFRLVAARVRPPQFRSKYFNDVTPS